MSPVYICLVLAIATGLASWYTIWYPCITEARDLGIKNELTLNPALSGLVYIIIAMLIFPVMMLVLLLPTDLFAKTLEATSKITHQETLS